MHSGFSYFLDFLVSYVQLCSERIGGRYSAPVSNAVGRWRPDVVMSDIW